MLLSGMPGAPQWDAAHAGGVGPAVEGWPVARPARPERPLATPGDEVGRRRAPVGPIRPHERAMDDAPEPAGCAAPVLAE